MAKKAFHEWEMKHDLLNTRSINGFQYWNYMRRDMFMSFVDEYASLEPAFCAEMKEQGETKVLLIKGKARQVGS